MVIPRKPGLHNWSRSYRTSIVNDKLIPLNKAQYAWSKSANELTKKRLKEEEEYMKKMSGEVTTFHISELDEK